MAWWDLGPTWLAAAAVYFLPGLLVLVCAGVRRLPLAALAAPMSATLAGTAAVLLPFAGVPFTPLTYWLAAATAALAAVGARALWRRSRAYRPLVLGAQGPLPAADLGSVAAGAMVPLGIAVAALIIGYRFMNGFGSPEAFSQTFDNVYHLNAVRHIVATENGSTLTLGNLTAASKGLYPAAMHDMMALLVMLGAPSVMAAVNVGTIVMGAVVWPLGCVFLVSRIVGYRPIPLLIAGVLSSAFSAFPYLLVAFGVLYPNHAAVALLPAVLALAVEALGVSRTPPTSPVAPVIALAAVLPGLALTHPSTIPALAAFAAPAIINRTVLVWVEVREGTAKRRAAVGWMIGTAVYALVSLALWIVLRPNLSTAGWTSFQSNARAIGEILSSAPMGTTIAWVLLPLTVIGLYVCARQLRRYAWVAGMFGVGAILYLVVSSWSNGAFRDFVTGIWYTDSYRLAALLPLVTLPVVVLGGEWLIWRLRWVVGTALHRLGEKRLPQLQRLPERTTAAVGVAAVLAMGVAAQGGTLSGVQERLRTIFATTPASGILSTDEVALLREVPAYVPEDGVVVGNPRTGASLVYAFSDRTALAPHIFGVRTPDEQLLFDHWGEAAYNPAVCPAIERLNAYWALDFGDKEITPRAEPLSGVRDLADGSAPGVELVHSVGQARLFRVTACD
ncbi:hypothetical protein GCM10028789_19750 [Sinomonas halotolerans]